MTPSGRSHRSGRLQRGTLALAYESWGAGQAVVCIHGFGTDREVLRELADSLADRFRVVLVDLRGHGASGSPPLSSAETTRHAADEEAVYGYAAQCEDLLALLDELGLAHTHWLGHSMGGQLALMAALRAPARALSLVALGAGASRPIIDDRERRGWTRAAERFEGMSQGELALALDGAAPRSSPAESQDSGSREASTQLYGRAQGKELARIVRGAFLPMRGNAAACRALQVPALIIAGEQDAQWFEALQQLAELLPRGEWRPVPDAGHLVQLDRPEVVTAAVGDFLSAQSRAAISQGRDVA